MRVVVIGAGHVGLVTAGALAALGHDVVAVDEVEEKVRGLRDGVFPFFEPGLQELVGRGVSEGCLRFAVEPADVLGDADVVFLCVGTPARASGEANLVWVERAARSIAGHLARPIVVVEKSTVPAGTAERLLAVLRLQRPDLAGEIEVVSNPEFLREGQAVQDS